MQAGLPTWAGMLQLPAKHNWGSNAVDGRGWWEQGAGGVTWQLTWREVIAMGRVGGGLQVRFREGGWKVAGSCSNLDMEWTHVLDMLLEGGAGG